MSRLNSPPLYAPQSILLVKNRALGDVIMGIGTLDYLRKTFPLAQITYAIPSWIVPLFSDVKLPPKVDIFPLELDSFKSAVQTFLKIKKLRPEIIIELHQSGRTRKFFNLYRRLTSTSYYYHNHHLKKGDFVWEQGKRKPNIQRDLDGVWSIFYYWEKKGYFKSPEKPSYIDYPPKMECNTSIDENKQIILGVVATRKTKMWPLEYFKELCLRLMEQDAELTFLIPLSQSKQDKELEKNIEKLNFPKNVKVVKRPLNELPILFSECCGYIGNDTGLKHLALAVGLPTITFFGPEEPLEWHPYDEKKHPYFFVDKLDCRTRLAHYCPLNECESMICLKQIEVDEVLKKLLQSS